jgi:hypothetical protein
MLSLAASKTKEKGKKIMLMDVKCAFLYGKMKRDLYVELPREDNRRQGGRMIGKLNKAMYGTRDAPLIWQEEVVKVMESLGFKSSTLQPMLFYNREKDLTVLAHVDDFLCVGDDVVLEWLFKEMSKMFEIKKQTISGDADQYHRPGSDYRHMYRDTARCHIGRLDKVFSVHWNDSSTDGRPAPS